MAKFCGKIGYAETKETSPGVWEEIKSERLYYGDLIRNMRRLRVGSKINDDITISNEISIIADQFAYDNFHSMRYAEFMGAKWKIDSVEVQHPRLILSLGDVYNGK